MYGYAGVDWAKEEHALCVLSGDGAPSCGGASPTTSKDWANFAGRW